MSEEKNETAGAVIEEAKEWMRSHDTIVGKRAIAIARQVDRMAVETFLDRIKAAHFRELQKVQEMAEDALCKWDEAARKLETVTKCNGLVHPPEKCTGPGNVAKLRKALFTVYDWILKAGLVHGYVDTAQKRRQLYDMMTKALAAKPRNCDVGKPWKQAERFKRFCESNRVFYRDMFGHDDEGRLDGWDCRKECPVGLVVDDHDCLHDHCELVWAQMPYDEKGGDK